jgi:hypothetical protein
MRDRQKNLVQLTIYFTHLRSLGCACFIQVYKAECTSDFAGSFRLRLCWVGQIVFFSALLWFLILEQRLVTAKIYFGMYVISTMASYFSVTGHSFFRWLEHISLCRFRFTSFAITCIVYSWYFILCTFFAKEPAATREVSSSWIDWRATS